MHFDVYYIGLEKMMRCELQGQIQVASASDQTSDDMPLPRWSFQQIHNFFFFFASFQNQNWPKKKNFQTTSLLLSKLALLNYDIVWSFPQRIFKWSVSVSFQHIFQNVFYVLLQHFLILTIFSGLWISFILERYLVFRRRRRQNRTSVLRRLFGFLA